MNHFSKDAFAANLRAERARLDISQEELAKRSGVSTAAVLSYENGAYVPGADKVCALAEVLGVTPNELCGWTS